MFNTLTQSAPSSLRSQALLCVVKKPQSKLVAVHLSLPLSLLLHAVIFNLLEIPSSQRGLFSSPLLSSPLHWQMVLKIRLLEEEPLHWPDCSMVTYCLKPCGAAAAAALLLLPVSVRQPAAVGADGQVYGGTREELRVLLSDVASVAGTSCSRSSVVAIVRRRGRPHRLHEARSLLYLSVPADERESPWVKGRAARVNRNALNARIGDPIPRLGLD